MKKIIILIPVFNDWESLNQLVFEINKKIIDVKDFLFECIIVNDASTSDRSLILKPGKINSFKILNMKKNKGHARCNAFGIRYINQNENFDYVILMDGDGEDQPAEVRKLIDKIISNPEKSVVAKRVKRSEGRFFQFLYFMHKLITYVFTGKNINFGNFSCLTKNDVETISSKSSLWSSYSGTIKKYIKNFENIDSIRGVRYFGPSKMSLYNLVLHSFSIIAVFKLSVLLRSIFIILTLWYLTPFLGLISIFLQINIIVFNILIFIVSLREKKSELLASQENLKNIEELNH